MRRTSSLAGQRHRRMVCASNCHVGRRQALREIKAAVVVADLIATLVSKRAARAAVPPVKMDMRARGSWRVRLAGGLLLPKVRTRS
jgi:hypothetical protein